MGKSYWKLEEKGVLVTEWKKAGKVVCSKVKVENRLNELGALVGSFWLRC